jgi:hypothetical protein
VDEVEIDEGTEGVRIGEDEGPDVQDTVFDLDGSFM